MTILIPSHCDDIHALAVHSALKHRDISSILYVGADYPSKMLSSPSIDNNNELSYDIQGTNIC